MTMQCKVRAALLTIAVLGSALVAACQQSPQQSGAQPEPRKPNEPVRVLSAFVDTADKGIEADRVARLQLKRRPDYVPIEANDAGTALFAKLEGSMADRRAAAWGIVEKMLAPEKLKLKDAAGVEQTYDVPLWHTWYEGMEANPEVHTMIRTFIAKVAACKQDTANCTDSMPQRRAFAKEVVDLFDGKGMEKSLTNTNLTQTLNQFKIDGTTPTNPAHLGQGATMFSPSFVEHMLSQAQGIEQCMLSGNARNSTEAPPSSSRFSHCIEEFPRSAVMVKTSWQVIGRPDSKVPVNDTSAGELQNHVTKFNSRWPNTTLSPLATKQNMYAVVDSDGTTHGLEAIHFSTKDTREWIWVTLWWDPNPDTDFGADRPASIKAYNGGVWANYKMCVSSAFTERDPAPWSGFEASFTGLAASLRTTFEARRNLEGAPPPSEIATWCTNPRLESHQNNNKTNCVGCHQHALAKDDAMAVPPFGNEFPVMNFTETLWCLQDGQCGDVERKKRLFPQYGSLRTRTNFPADFSWSVSGPFRDVIFEARTNPETGFEW